MISSNANLKELDPSEILKPSSLQLYEDNLNRIWQELLRLNSNLFVLDKLLNFPSDLFLEPQQTFLTLVRISLSHDSLLIITKLVTDTGNKLSMPRFKNWVRGQIKEEYLKSFDHSLRENRFKKTIQAASEKIKPIRHNFIAHLTIDENMRPKVTKEIRVAFPELQSICEQMNSHFDLLCFGEERLMLPIDYSPTVQRPVGSDPRSDIEYFLDLIVQDSALFKMSEESPYWDIYREGLSPETINILNEYRRKLGKPEV